MKQVNPLIKLDIDELHLDIMDGNFVNNLALNLDIIKQVRPLTRIPFIVHLMVQRPSHYLDDQLPYLYSFINRKGYSIELIADGGISNFKKIILDCLKGEYALCSSLLLR